LPKVLPLYERAERPPQRSAPPPVAGSTVPAPKKYSHNGDE
jgi:hypothetical protein